MQLSKLKFLPLGNQLFWFRETFLQIKSPAPKFRHHGDQNGHNLEGCHGSKYFGSQQSFLTKTAIKVHLKNGRKVWATIFFLLAIMHRKVIHVHFLGVFFAINLQDHVLLRSRNLLPWRSDITISPLFITNKYVPQAL